MLDELMKDVVAMNIVVPNAELEAYYGTRGAAMLSALKIRAAHIVLPTESQAKDVKHQLNQGYNLGNLRSAIPPMKRQKLTAANLVVIVPVWWIPVSNRSCLRSSRG